MGIVLGLSNAARTGLTGYVAGTARQVAGSGVTINNLLPGIHDTDRAVSLDTGVSTAQGISLDEARANREATIPAKRYGTREEFGAACLDVDQVCEAIDWLANGHFRSSDEIVFLAQAMR